MIGIRISLLCTLFLSVNAFRNATIKVHSISLVDSGQIQRQRSASSRSSFDTCLIDTLSVLESVPDPSFLTLKDWQTFCPSFPDSQDMVCDFGTFDAYDSGECSAAGGQIVPLDTIMCGVNLYVSEGFSSGYTVNFEKITLKNFPQCGGTLCSDGELERIINGDLRRYGADCPTEKRFSKFAHKFKDGKLTTKTCQWLSTQTSNKKRGLCRAKRFQLYSQGYLPASRMCRETCSQFNCVQEKLVSQFLHSTQINEITGELEANTRQCRMLLGKKPEKIIEFCWPSDTDLVYLDTQYGYGWQVCTSSCPGSCLN